MSAVILPFPRSIDADLAPDGGGYRTLPAERDARIDRMAELVAGRARRLIQGEARTPVAARCTSFRDQVPGSTGIEVVFRVAAWALSARSLPTSRQFMDHWGMSRATACRYRRALLNAGLLPKEAQ